MTASLIPAVQSLITQAIENHAFLGTVAAVTGGLVYLVRPGQTAPDRSGYVCAIDPTTLAPGDRVSVLQHGASYVVMGKLSVSTTPPPLVGPPAVATGCYLGVQPPSYGTPLFQFEADCGKHAAIVGLTYDWARSPLDSSTIQQVQNHGSLPLVTWEPLDQSGLLPPAGFSPASIVAGAWDAFLAASGAVLAGLRGPTLLRLMPEPNAATYPWAGNPSVYVPAWRHVHDLVAPLAPNVQWVWCPRVWGGSDPTVTDPAPSYPGDAYVDWVGLDGYNSVPLGGAWLSFSELFGFSYGQAVSAYLKPLLLCEWGCDEDPRKAAWLTTALTVELPSFFPQLAGVVYNNQDQRAVLGLGADWPIESSAAAQAAFAAGMAAAYFLASVP